MALNSADHATRTETDQTALACDPFTQLILFSSIQKARDKIAANTWSRYVPEDTGRRPNNLNSALNCYHPTITMGRISWLKLGKRSLNFKGPVNL